MDFTTIQSCSLPKVRKSTQEHLLKSPKTGPIAFHALGKDIFSLLISSPFQQSSVRTYMFHICGNKNNEVGNKSNQCDSLTSLYTLENLFLWSVQLENYHSYNLKGILNYAVQLS